MALLVVVFNASYHFWNIIGLNYIGSGIDFLLREFRDPLTKVKWPFGWDFSEGHGVMQVISLFFAAMLVTGLFKMVSQVLSSERMAALVHVRIIPRLQRQVFDKIQNLSFSYFDKASTGAIINKAAGDVQSVRAFVDTVLVEGLTLMITLSLYATNMILINLKLALVCLFTLPLMVLSSYVFSHIVRPRIHRSRVLFDRLVLGLSEYVEGVKTVKGLSLEERLGEDLHARNDAVEAQQRSVFWCTSLFSPTINTLSQLGIVVLLIYGGRLAIDGKIEIGTGLVVFATLLQQFSNQINSFSHLIAAIQESFTGAQRIFGVLDTPVPVSQAENPVRLRRMRGAVEFENVCFEFTENKTALENINFKVEPGTCVALMGETGSGKSAMLNLLARFYDPQKGEIRIDGYNVKQLDLDQMRRDIGVLFQETFLFADTVINNIRFGNPEASEEEVYEAARQAHVHDFILQLDDGYQSYIQEGAKNLSGGQRQRIGLARVLLSNPHILLLDDPSSAVDSKTEKAIFEAIEDTIKSRTTFMVAHRISTLKRADRILVLKQGRIVQDGDHETLLRQPGHYRDAALLQAEYGKQATGEKTPDVLAGDLKKNAMKKAVSW